MLLASFLLTIVPALANEFEVGTRFGISHLAPDTDEDSFSTSITYTNIPSAPAYVGSTPTALYATWFPSDEVCDWPGIQFGENVSFCRVWGRVGH